MMVGIWEMMLQDFARELRYLATCNICPTHPLSGQVETTYPAKKANVQHEF